MIQSIDIAGQSNSGNWGARYRDVRDYNIK